MTSDKTKEIIDIYNKKDIMKLFKCESDKALRILKVMLHFGLAFKVGREYYVSKENMLKFLHEAEGRKLLI